MEAYIFLIPWLIGVCLFFAYPIFVSIRLAFSDIVEFKGLKTAWVGLENFRYIFFYDINFVPTFLKVVTDTLLNTPLCMVFSLIIAIFINRRMVGRGFFRTAFFIPVLLGTGYIMKQLLGMGVDGMTVTTGILVPKLIADLLGPSITEVVQGFLDRITVVLWKSGVQIVLFHGMGNVLENHAAHDLPRYHDERGVHHRVLLHRHHQPAGGLHLQDELHQPAV